MSTPLQDSTFVDFNEAGLWSDGYLFQAAHPCSYVYSLLSPDGNLVSNDSIAPFRSQTNRSILADPAFVAMMQSLGDLHYMRTIMEFVSGEREFSEENFVQIYAGLLPISLSVQNNLYTTNHQLDQNFHTVFLRFYEWVGFLTDKAVARVWPGFWAAELLYIENCHYREHEVLLFEHLKALATENCPPCMLASFPFLRISTNVDQYWEAKYNFPYDWGLLGAAAKAYLHYCIRSVKIDQAIKTLALAIRCSAVKSPFSLREFVDTVHDLSSFFPEFPENYSEKAEIINYLLTPPSGPVLSLEDILADQMLDSPTYQELIQQYPQAAAKLVTLSVSKANLLLFITSSIPDFPTTSSQSLSCLLSRLTGEEQFEVCWALKGKRVLGELERLGTVRRVRRLQRMVVVWTALVKKRIRLPKCLILEVLMLI